MKDGIRKIEAAVIAMSPPVLCLLKCSPERYSSIGASYFDDVLCDKPKLTQSYVFQATEVGWSSSLPFP